MNENNFLIYIFIVLSFSVRVWDVAILIPNLIFMMYLVTKFSRARLKLRAANSPIFFTFYCLVNNLYYYSYKTFAYLNYVIITFMKLLILLIGI